MTRYSLLAKLIFITLVAVTCSAHEDQPKRNSENTESDDRSSPSLSATTQRRTETDTVELTANESELLQYVACNHSFGQFITTTPRKQWTNRGGWKRLPASFHEQLELKGRTARPATEVYLLKGELFVPEAEYIKRSPRLAILEIIEWKSENSAIVRVTHHSNGWCGNGKEPIEYAFEKIDDNWQLANIKLR